MGEIRVALVIQNCRIGRFDDNLDLSLELVSQAAKLGATLAIFPEMNLTGYVAGPTIHDIARPLDSQWISRLANASDKYKMVILAGLAEKDAVRGIRPTHLVFSPGMPLDLYRKIHLSPQEAPIYSAGNQVRVFHTGGLHFGIQLCYDAHFPELSTAMALKKADVIFMPHASPRGTPREKFESWMRHMTARAFDNGVYIAAVNQCGDNGGGLEFPGVAMVVGPDGLLKSKQAAGCSAIHMAQLDMRLVEAVRSHRMRYFLPNRRTDLFS